MAIIPLTPKKPVKIKKTDARLQKRHRPSQYWSTNYTARFSDGHIYSGTLRSSVPIIASQKEAMLAAGTEISFSDDGQITRGTLEGTLDVQMAGQTFRLSKMTDFYKSGMIEDSQCANTPAVTVSGIKMTLKQYGFIGFFESGAVRAAYIALPTTATFFNHMLTTPAESLLYFFEKGGLSGIHSENFARSVSDYRRRKNHNGDYR